jgi:hypothetical protein
MIRIKCPKCAFSLALDDDEAGQVGECTECGARFRVPTPKAGAPGKSRPPESKKRPPPRRRDDDVDEDEDDFEEKEEEGTLDKPIKLKGMSPMAKMNIQMAITFCVCIVILGVAEIFIPRLGLALGIACEAVHLVCTLMVARQAWSDSPITFLLVWFCGPFFIYYCITNWDRTQSLCVTAVALWLMAFVSYFAHGLQEGRKEVRREEIREMLFKSGYKT